MNLREIWKNKTIDSTGLFTLVDDQEYRFMKEYVMNPTEIDRMLVHKYGSREFDLEVFEYGGTSVEHSLNNMFNVFLITNKELLQRMYDAINAEYEPLNNYDKTSTITTSYEGKETNELDKNTTMAYNGSEVDTLVKGENVTETENKVSAFDSSDYSPSNKTTTTDHTNTDTSTRTFTNRTDRTSGTDTSTKEFENRKDIVTERTFGNIGVTTSDQMLKDFLAQRVKLDFYVMMFEKFLLEFSW